MLRNIIEIDESKCNGCGLCADACHEGAIGMVGGKAALLRDDYCDGLGDCLPACPTGAIKIVEREAEAFDAEAAMRGKEPAKAECGCPGSASRLIERSGLNAAAGPTVAAGPITAAGPTVAAGLNAAARPIPMASELRQWPVQIRLAPVNAPYFAGANLLIAADCSAYARAGFHAEFMRGKVTLIGCPKLDAVDYADKLAAIISNNDIKSLTVARMEVPCCAGLERAAASAIKTSGKRIPWRVVMLGTDGEIRVDCDA